MRIEKKKIAKIVELTPSSTINMVIRNMNCQQFNDLYFYNLTGEDLFYHSLCTEIDEINPSIYSICDNGHQYIDTELNNFLYRHKRLIVNKKFKYKSVEKMKHRCKKLNKILSNKNEGVSVIDIYLEAEYKALNKFLYDYDRILNNALSPNLPKPVVDVFIEYDLDSLLNCDIIEDNSINIAIGRITAETINYISPFSSNLSILNDEDSDNGHECNYRFHVLIDNENNDCQDSYWTILNSKVPVKVKPKTDEFKPSGIYEYMKNSDETITLIDFKHKYKDDSSDINPDYINNVFHSKHNANIAIKHRNELQLEKEAYVAKKETIYKKAEVEDKKIDVESKKVDVEDKKLESESIKYKLDEEKLKKAAELEKEKFKTNKQKYKTEQVKNGSEQLKALLALGAGIVGGYSLFKSGLFNVKSIIGTISNFIPKILNVGSMIVDFIIGTISSVIDIVSSCISSLVNTVTNTVGSLFSGIKSMFSFA